MQGYIYITNPTQLGNFFTDLSATDIIGFDTETTGLNPFSDTIILIQVRINDSIYLFDAIKYAHCVEMLTSLNTSGKTIVGHNLDFDMRFIMQKYHVLFLNVYDTMLADMLINNGISETKYPSLVSLVEKYCQRTLNKEIREKFYNDASITEEKLIYAAEDVLYLRDIYLRQFVQLKQTKQWRVAVLEMKVLPIVVSMELTGIKINVDKWNGIIADTRKTADRLREEIISTIVADSINTSEYKDAYDLSITLGMAKKSDSRKFINMMRTLVDPAFITDFLKSNININSPKQMLAILTNIYKVPIEDTHEKTLNKLTYKYPIINKLIVYRGFEKELSSFGDGFVDKINPTTGRIHTSYNQLGAVTGRFSSESPNLQNVKGIDKDEHDAEVSKYRPCFEADDNKLLISADYSQQELRIVAEVTKDAKMLETFRSELDPHTVTASGLFKVPYDKVSKDQRKKGKSLNFAVNYGSSEYGLAYNFNIPIEEGKKYIEDYFKFYFGYATFVAIIGQKIWDIGYSTTMLGRKRFFKKPLLFDSGFEAKKFKSRTIRSLTNHIIQGTGADMTKQALINIFYDNPFGDKLKILLQVHDEIVLEVEESIIKEAKDFVQEQMLKAESVFIKSINCKVDVNESKVWKH